MAGWLSNGAPTIGAITNNGTAAVAPLGTYTNLGATTATVSTDTNQVSGTPPETVAATPFDFACVAIALIKNAGSSTAHTVTQNVLSGCVETEALTTAAGADYTFQWVNSLITATSPPPHVQIHSGSNTVTSPLIVKSITNTSGTCTAVFTNAGTAALNGTMVLGFHV